MTGKIGILHPGEMGVFVAASAQNNGKDVFWVSEGRSPETQARAHKHSLIDAHTLEELCRTCSILISVCPPHAAEETARLVQLHSFKGLYADLNAISPQRAVRIGEMMEENGISFVDGGIFGSPAWETGSTWLYLSGRETQRIAACFSSGRLQVQELGRQIGKASALKMCYSAFSKGSTALLCSVLAAAKNLDVYQELEQQWAHGDPGFPDQAENRVRKSTAKAWRFAGEMEEIASTFTGAGLPGGFHAAAAEIYRRLADYRGSKAIPELTEILDTLLGYTGEDPAI